jgi:hypothetical protein
MHDMNTFDFLDGLLKSVLAVYFLLGMFSSASWLHTDGRRKDGHWVLFRMSRFARTFIFLVCSFWAFQSFARAFHRDFSSYYLPIDLSILIGFLFGLLISRKSRQNDTAA